jgi:hypothetical protein
MRRQSDVSISEEKVFAAGLPDKLGQHLGFARLPARQTFNIYQAEMRLILDEFPYPFGGMVFRLVIADEHFQLFGWIREPFASSLRAAIRIDTTSAFEFNGPEWEQLEPKLPKFKKGAVAIHPIGHNLNEGLS